MCYFYISVFVQLISELCVCVCVDRHECDSNRKCSSTADNLQGLQLILGIGLGLERRYGWTYVSRCSRDYRLKFSINLNKRFGKHLSSFANFWVESNCSSGVTAGMQINILLGQSLALSVCMLNRCPRGELWGTGRSLYVEKKHLQNVSNVLSRCSEKID